MWARHVVTPTHARASNGIADLPASAREAVASFRAGPMPGKQTSQTKAAGFDLRQYAIEANARLRDAGGEGIVSIT
jgi:hypothetical protein